MVTTVGKPGVQVASITKRPGGYVFAHVEGSLRPMVNGTPLAGARIDVWEADEDGRYDVQYDAARRAARGHLFTDGDGGYRFWALTPTPYPIPDDGPVGQLLRAVGRSPLRAAHLHFRVAHEGARTLVTHLFPRGRSDRPRRLRLRGQGVAGEGLRHPAGGYAHAGRAGSRRTVLVPGPLRHRAGTRRRVNPRPATAGPAPRAGRRWHAGRSAP